MGKSPMRWFSHRRAAGVRDRRAQLFPRTQNAAEENQFPDMIRVVVSHLKRLAQKRLTLPMRKRRKQIGFRIGNQFAHGFEVALERLHAVFPGCCAIRFRALRPIPVRPCG